MLSWEPLNKSAAALSRSFAPTYRFENLEIHEVFLQVPNLNLETKSLADRSCDLIRGSLDSFETRVRRGCGGNAAIRHTASPPHPAREQ